MKPILFIVMFLTSISVLHAQDYQISFTASGYSTHIDSIQVENLTQGSMLSLAGDDVLHLAETFGINEQNTRENTYKFYPNPILEAGFLEFFNSKTERIELAIYNGMGILIIRQCQVLRQGRQKLKLTGLKEGMYIVNINSSCWQFAAKIISLGPNKGNIAFEYLSWADVNKTISTQKSSNNIITMQYNEGERLLFKGFSGNYARVLTLVPTQSQTVDFEFIPCSDLDGNNYAVVTIGEKAWMAENLKTRKYNDGNDIPHVIDGDTWGSLSSPAYCWYMNDIANKPLYGALYNWYAVETAKLCPEGWHVPSHEEWSDLSSFAGGESIAGGRLKGTHTEPHAHPRWREPNTGATNEYGFTGLPGSYRNSGSGGFSGLGNWGHWWSSTEDIPGFAFGWRLVYYNESSDNEWGLKVYGYSVRCVKD